MDRKETVKMNLNLTLALINMQTLAANEPEPAKLRLKNTQSATQVYAKTRIYVNKSNLTPLCEIKQENVSLSSIHQLLISSHSDIYISNMWQL